MRVYTSNRAEALAALLCDSLAEVGGDPFAPPVVVVHSRGMQAWLSQRIADRLGICANVEFPFPARYVTELFELILGVEADRLDAWRRARLRWPIFALLPRWLDRPEFEEIRRYLTPGDGDDPAAVPMKRFQLAERIARVFEGYCTYRPEQVLRWQAGDDDPVATWQPTLWRALREATGAPNVAELAAAFVATLEGGASPGGVRSPTAQLALPGFDAGGPSPTAAGVPERIHVFGITSLPPLHLRVLGALSHATEVRFYQLSPSREFFADIASRREIARREERSGRPAELDFLDLGNPLLGAWGRLGREFQRLIHDAGVALVDSGEVWEDPTDGDEAPTALRVLQSDILNLRHRTRGDGAPRGPLAPTPTAPLVHDPGDRSIEVHACHSAMRQVEVLQDRILDALESDPTLEPHQIVVLCPELDRYAPLIDAVFGRRLVPYRIADRSLRRQSPVAEALLTAIGLVESRMTASGLMDLLAMEPVAERFSVGPNDLPRVSRWVEKTGIRWGIDAAHRARCDQPAYDQNTWRFGLDRMMLGVAMRGDDDALFCGVRPYDPLEGDDARLAGRLAGFAEAMFGLAERLSEPRSMPRWCRDIADALGTVAAATDDNAWQHEHVRGVLAEIEAETEAAGASESVPLDVARVALDGALERDAAPHGFLSGGVTFCQSLPMRAIPFEVVCLLGMEERAFPRRSTRLEFDLAVKMPLVGDRSLRDDDRYLFLEALLSARRRLLITYRGHGIRDNKPLPPSVVVTELLDTLAETYDTVGEERPHAPWVVNHPLQPFSHRYFHGEGPLFSFAEAYVASARSALGSRAEPPVFIDRPLDVDPEPVVPLADLIAFFRHPVRSFCRETLGLTLTDPDDPLLDREPIVLDRLEQAIIAGELLARAVDGQALPDTYEPVRAEGVLPLGQPGRTTHAWLAQQVAPLDRFVEHYRSAGADSALEVDIDTGHGRVVGRIRDVFAGRLVRHQYARVSARGLLSLWIEHLAACAASPEREFSSVLIGRAAHAGGHSSPRTVEVVRFGPMPEANEVLARLVRLRAIGRSEPLLLFPRTSYAWQSALMSHIERDAWKADRPTRDAWFGTFNGPPGESADPYVARVFGRQSPLDTDFPRGGLPTAADASFKELADRVFRPLIDAREEKL